MSIWRTPKPVIAQVHGWCVGGGSDMALCADLIIASEDAQIGTPYSRIWGCYLSGMWLYRLGLTKAKEHALTGKPLSGREAADVELINAPSRSTSSSEAVTRAGGAARARSRSSQLAAMKLIVNQAYENMGLQSTQTLGPILDGLMRNTPDAEAFIATGGRQTASAPRRTSATSRSATTAWRARRTGRTRTTSIAPVNLRTRRYASPPVDYPVETFTEQERAQLRPALHEPRPAGVRARQPARDGQGRAVRALLALPGDAAAAVPRRVRGRPHRRTRRRLRRAPRASARRSSTSGSSSATAMTRSPSSAAPTSPASGSRTCSRRSSSARGSARTSSSRRATSPTTPRCPGRRGGATATTATPSSAPSTSARWTSCSRSTRASLPRVAAWAEREFPLEPGEQPAAHARAIKAKALDLLRGLLPASSLSHMGIFASGQTYEQLILHLLAHPLPRGAPVRRDDPRRDQGGDAELRRPGRAPGPRRGVDRAPAITRPRRRAVGAPARARRARARRRARGRR